MLLRKYGILFVLVEARAGSFEELSKRISRYVKRFSDQPLVVVFPEFALGEKRVSRRRTKNWMSRLAPILQAHGQAHVFLSLLERAPLNRTVTNTGYLISPPAKRGSRSKVFWQASPKRLLTRLDELGFLHNEFSGSRPNPGFARERAHWLARSARMSLGKTPTPNRLPAIEALRFSFPRVRINGRSIELRICADLMLKGTARADVLVVPAQGLFDPESYERSVRRFAQAHGFALIHDLQPSDRRPQVTLASPRRRVRVFHSRPKVVLGAKGRRLNSSLFSRRKK